MDEEHFKTFARDVLPPILDEGRQVIILTHNETFARDISYWHYERSNYVTLRMRLSRKDGCLVDEGNRRFNERLRGADNWPTKVNTRNLGYVSVLQLNGYTH